MTMKYELHLSVSEMNLLLPAIESYIKLIQTSGKDIIFEGVETEQQAYYLGQCGCDNAQGYLFSRAICVEEYENKYLK